jgi:hypothetical protein
MKPVNKFPTARRVLLLAIGACLGYAPLPAKAGLILTNAQDFTRVLGHIDFEASSGQGTIAGINNYLAGTGTLSIGTAIIWNTSHINETYGGYDGGGVYGPGNLTKDTAESGRINAILTFDSGQEVDAFGFYLGGVGAFQQAYPAVSTVFRVTYADGSSQSISVAELTSALPFVANDNPSSQAINGFIGVDGDGKLIKSFQWTHVGDVHSLDDIYFGAATASGTKGMQSFAEYGAAAGSQPPPPVDRPVPEPSPLLLLATGAFGLAMNMKRRRTSARGQKPGSLGSDGSGLPALKAASRPPVLGKATVALAACFVLSAGGAAAAPITAPSFFNLPSDITINFESLPGVTGVPPSGMALTVQLAGLGVSFSSEDVPGALQTTDPGDASGRFEAPFRILGAVAGAGAPRSGARYAGGDKYIGSGGLNVSDMRIDFLAPVDAFGFYLIDNDFSDARISAYATSGTLLESLVVPEVGEGGYGYHGIAAAGIAYAIIDGAGGAALDSSFIDDLSFRAGAAAAPEPSSLLLLALGAAFLGLWSSRRAGRAAAN